ncbi:MAG: TonB-dependent receptor [Thermoanaerobaculia bacterium]|nr:TonB-dependent receptor [Thermoanaerobaculia bacterium]
MRRFARFLLGFLLAAVPLLAQTPAGGISGTVRDASGSGMPGATITITNQQSGASRVVTSGTGGAYTVADLPPGTYSVAADLSGVGRAEMRDRQVSAGATVTADLTLEARVRESVTVTAMRREETVLSTPLSIAAPTEDVMRERGIENVEDIAANVAGFTVQNLGPGQSQVAIRGVSSGQISRDQPGPKEEVGTYLDESVISFLLFTPNVDLFDMNRVEVLRGPQGTLFGSGSLSGTVRYISNQPLLGTTQYFGEFAASAVSDGDAGGKAKFGMNVPLGSTAALRVVGYYDHFAGYMDAVQPDRSVQEDVNSGDRYGVRAAIQIAPNDQLTILPRLLYQKIEMDGWNRIDDYNILANPFTTTRPAVNLGERQLFTQVDEPYTDEFLLADLNVTYDFGDLALTSITSYTDRDILVVRDAGALTSSITGGSFGLPENVYTLDAPLADATTASGWTQEIRLSGTTGRLQWLAGGFYSDAEKDYGQHLDVAGYEALVPTGDFVNTRTIAPRDALFFSELTYQTRQYAFFGEGTLALTDRFSFIAGLRYYNFKDDKEQIFDGLFGAGAGGRPQSAPGTTEADGVAPRFIASYKVSESTTINAQVAKGFRLGGINDPLNVSLCTPADLVTFGGQEGFKDETAWNYEIGTKTGLFGGSGSFAVSAFYMDITDLQVVVTAGSCSSRLVFSVPEARSVGGDVEFSAAVSDNFDFSFSASYNDAELLSTVTASGPNNTTVIVSGIEDGRRLPSVPEFQLAAAATYQQVFRAGFVGYVNGTYTHIGSRFTQVGDEDPATGVVNLFTNVGGPLTQNTFRFNPELPAYDLINVRVGARFSNLDVALFANNVTDERAYLALDRERGLRARVGYLTNQPRTFGVTTRVDF